MCCIFSLVSGEGIGLRFVEYILWDATLRYDQRFALTKVSGKTIIAAGMTHVGCVRPNNEDAFRIDLDSGLFLVADGMGGHLSGEVASSMAVELISRDYRKWFENQGKEVGEGLLTACREALLESIRRANEAIFVLSQGDPRHRGMGTTLVALAAAGDGIVQFHVGDSRIYRLRDGQLVQLTEDHSWIAEQVRMGLLTEEEARLSKAKNVITRALGVVWDVEVDIATYPRKEGDLYLLCTDGLSDAVPREIIEEVLKTHMGDLEEAAKALIDQALSSGGPDNVTVVLVGIGEKDVPWGRQ